MHFTLGDKIKGIRMANDMSQEELSFLLEVSPAIVSSWERNGSKPNGLSMFKLQTLFSLSKEFFFTDSLH